MASKHSPFPHPSKTSSQSSHGHDSWQLPCVPGAAGSSVFLLLVPCPRRAPAARGAPVRGEQRLPWGRATHGGQSQHQPRLRESSQHRAQQLVTAWQGVQERVSAASAAHELPGSDVSRS